MSLLDAFVASPLAARLGWVFLHFLWQGALIACVLWAVMAALGKGRSDARYLASCVALGLMLVAPVATYLLMAEPQAQASLPALLAALDHGTELTAQKSADWRTLVPALTLFWLFGTLVQQARLLYLWWGTERLRHSFHLPMPSVWQESVAKMSRRLGIRVPVRVVESAKAEVPTVVGWLAPIILVPSSALLQLSTEQLRMVLAHELAHVRRHDYLVNLIQTAVESLLFFHPAVWWISNQLRVEREFCCDDIAVGLGGNPLVYARALERLETLREGEPQLALASTGGSLMQRIQRLVQPQSTARKSLTLSFAPAALLLVGALSSTAFGFAGNLTGSQDEQKLSDDELERRIAELKSQIGALEGRLHELRREPRSTRFGLKRDARSGQEEHGNFRVHVDAKGEHGGEHEGHGEPRVRRFDLDLGNGEHRTIEIQIPEIHIPEIHIPDIRVPDGHAPRVEFRRRGEEHGEHGQEVHKEGESRYRVRVPEMRFGPEGGQRFEIRVPKIDMEEIHGQVEVHLRELGEHLEGIEEECERFEFKLGEGEEGNVFFFGDDGDGHMKQLFGKLENLELDDLHEHLEDVDFGKLHEHLEDVDFGKLHEHLEDVDFGKLHESLEDIDFGKLHGELEHIDFGKLHEHLGNVEVGTLQELKLEMGDLHQHLLKSMEGMKGLRLQRGDGSDERTFRFEFDGEDFDASKLHEHLQRSLEGLEKHGAKGSAKGSAQGMQFLIEVDADGPKTKKRGFRWSSKDGEEPSIWIFDGDEGQAHEHKDAERDGAHEDGDHDRRGVGIDWDRYDGSKDA